MSNSRDSLTTLTQFAHSRLDAIVGPFRKIELKGVVCSSTPQIEEVSFLKVTA
jgi:hypothetical protein